MEIPEEFVSITLCVQPSRAGEILTTGAYGNSSWRRDIDAWSWARVFSTAQSLVRLSASESESIELILAIYTVCGDHRVLCDQPPPLSVGSGDCEEQSEGSTRFYRSLELTPNTIWRQGLLPEHIATMASIGVYRFTSGLQAPASFTRSCFAGRCR